MAFQMTAAPGRVGGDEAEEEEEDMGKENELKKGKGKLWMTKS